VSLNKLSASSIAAFKKCGVAFRLAYVEGLRPAIEADTLRTGSSWHGALEAYETALREWVPADPGDTVSDEVAQEAMRACAMTAAVEYLNERYAECPTHKDLKDWRLEHTTLITCLAGYVWYWQNDPVEVLAVELPFDLPLHMPKSGLPLPTAEVVRTGKIDALVQRGGKIGVLERKTTSRSIDPDSDFWDRWRKDTQISNYCLALRDMKAAGLLPKNIPLDMPWAGVIVDIFRKPTIKPAMLTQKETAEFIETGKYYGEEFQVAKEPVWDRGQPTLRCLLVDDEYVNVEDGKKGFAIRETLKMFSARLLMDIQQTPEKYFARREIARTDQELSKFRKDLFVTYQSMKLHDTHDLWVENESSCDAPYRCAYKSICYGAGSEAACDRQAPVPAGFKRLAYVDLTVSAKGDEA
jgi:hypothetical protein